MKGLIVSLLATGWYVLSSAALMHGLRPKRHSTVFLLMLLACMPVYFLLYFYTPADLYFLPRCWQCSCRWLDVVYGFVVFLLNCHSFIDTVFAVCGGFSTSLLVAIRQAGCQPMTADALVARFKTGADTDRIYEWRIPHMEKRGYIRRDFQTGQYSLSRKGYLIAQLTVCLKRLMNLGEGG